jgi:hypothetical protein
VDEFIGSQQTFEMTINDRPEKKNKSISFVSKENHEDNLLEAITLISKKFNKTLDKLQARWKMNVPNKMSNIKSQSKVKDEDKPEQVKWIRCFECEGLCHIRRQCPTYLKKQKRGMTITLSDSDEENEGETTNKEFTRKNDQSYIYVRD